MLAILTHQGRVATLTINRPEARNAMSMDLLAALHQRVDELAAMYKVGANGDIQGEPPIVCVVRGEGKAFCAGMDLKQVLGVDGAAQKLLLSLGELCHKVRMLPCVVVGHVNGPAIGGGCGLVTVCDLAVTYADNKMGFPEVDLGICPAVISAWLVRKIGAGPARKVLLTGGLLSGKECADLGIVTGCVPTLEELPAAVDAVVSRLGGGSLNALAATKKLLNELDGSDNVEQARRAADLSARVISSPDSQALLRAKLK
ncbi:MAG: enoyl-CoA hydratase/isomerase family protein [Phycisphaerales bacterium]|nr:enoyl-CoA hydratase/isomerase family protein [Phycisphaerales bacterium]